MANTLMHKVETLGSETVETVGQLTEAIRYLGLDDEAFLDETYVVELIEEVLSDRSRKRSMRIRLAERA